MSEYYTREALLEQLELQKYIQDEEIHQMLQESQFLQECYETKMVVITEAIKSDLSHGIILSVQAFIQRIADLFRKSSIASYKSMFNDDSIKQIRANIKTVQANCMKLEPQKVMPYWKGNPYKDSTELQSAMRQAFNNIKAGKIDYGFASKFVKETKFVENQDTRLSAYLKNYFRYGDNDLDDPQPMTLTGKEIANLLPAMLNYMEKYPTDIAAFPGKISDAFNNQSKTVKFPGDTSAAGTVDTKPANTQQATTDSLQLTPDTYLMVEDRCVCETMLPLFRGYSVLEADDKQTDADKKKAQDEAKKMNGNGETDEKGNPKSATTVEPADGTKANEGNGEESDTNTEKSKSELMDYLKDVTAFFQLAVAAYNTTLEERFTVYGKLLRMVAKDYMQVPKSRKDKAAKDKKAAIEDSNRKRGKFRNKKKK